MVHAYRRSSQHPTQNGQCSCFGENAVSLTDLLLYLAVLTNIGCTAWNIACARRYIRALDAMAAERAELLTRVNTAMAMPRTAPSPVPFGWTLRPPDGQASSSGRLG